MERLRVAAVTAWFCLAAVTISPPPRAIAAPAERTVTFVTTDRIRVAGTVFGSGPIGVVLAHMLDGTQRDWAPFARLLAAEGYTALAFDFRGHGKTRGPSGTDNLEREVLAAVGVLKGQGVQRLVLIGASMGGTAAVKAAATGAAAAIVVISSPMTFGANITAGDLGRITVPSLWIVSAGDTDFTRPMRTMHDGVKGPKAFHEYTGSWHGTQFFGSPHRADFTRRMLDFLKQHVPPR